jgi:hypothetical protein
MKYFIILVISISLLYSCSKDNNATNPDPTSNVKIHVFFVAEKPGIYDFKRQGEGTYSISTGKTFVDSISIIPTELKKWTIKILYYNSLTNNRISIYDSTNTRTIDITNNILTCTGFSSYVGPGVVNGYVEEK